MQNPLPSIPFMFSVGVPDNSNSTSASDRKLTLKISNTDRKSSFNQVLEKIGASAKLIPDLNPAKLSVNSPKNVIKVGLPFQRRARSSSPFKENLNFSGNVKIMHSPRSPVVVSHKIKFKEDFTGLCRESGNFLFEEDEDLKNLKEAYYRQLEEANILKYVEDTDIIGEEGKVDKIESQLGYCKKNAYF